MDRLLGFAQLQMQVVQHSELCFENLLFHLITNHFFRNCGVVCDGAFFQRTVMAPGPHRRQQECSP